jgi:hypothetical protein
MIQEHSRLFKEIMTALQELGQTHVSRINLALAQNAELKERCEAQLAALAEQKTSLEAELAQWNAALSQSE